MKRIFLFLLTILLFTQCSFNNKKIIVSLETVIGYKPFGFRQKFCFEKSVDSILVSNVPLPKINTKLSIRVFHTQPDQYYAYLYRNGIIDSSYFNKIKSRYKIDNSKLYNGFLDESVLIAIGDLNDSTIIIYVDKNNNNKLSDESPIYYKKYKNVKDEKSAMKNLNPISVECENYDGFHKIRKSIPLLLNPYKGSLILYGSWSKQNYLAASIYEHRSGYIKIQNNNYNIQLNNGNTSTNYNSGNVILTYSGIADSIIDKTNIDDLFYEIGEVINIANYDLRIDSIDYTGSKLFITEIGKNEKPFGLRVGNKAPIIDGKDIYGNYFNLKEYRGKYVLIDFWGTWCKPCLKEIPNLKAINKNYSKNKLEIISIALDANIDSVKNFVKNNKMNWVHLFQSFDNKSKNSFTKKYKIRIYPSTFLLDPEGRILFKNLVGEKLTTKIDSLIM